MVLEKLRLPGFGSWQEDPLWGSVYDWVVEHPRVGGTLWRAGTGSDLSRLYDATAAITRQPRGSSVLDVPSGGGLALRGLRPGQGLHYVAADISSLMLERTMQAAHERGVADQVEPLLADVGSLPFGDGEFDLVVTLTGLHCFPDPRAAVREIVRVTHPDGVVVGSAVLNGTGLRYLPMREVGRFAGLIGPSASAGDLRRWLREDGCEDVSVEVSGALGYFRAVKSR